MKALLSICLLLALLCPVSARERMRCYHCMGEDCAKPTIEVCKADEDACYAALTETTLVSGLMPEYNVIVRQCAPARFCLNSDVSLSTTDDGTARCAVKCCYTDLCNNMTVSLPPRKEFPPNGVVCPGCFLINSTECPEVDMACTGGETKCFEATLHISVGFIDVEADIYIKGCTTPNLCYAPLVDAKTTPKKLKIIFNEKSCSDGVETETTGEPEFSTFSSSPFPDNKNEVGGQVNRT